MKRSLLIFCFLVGPLSALATPAIIDAAAMAHPEMGQRGMVVSCERLATAAGVEILRAGGNAADAGVAVAFALAVTTPQAGNLGGGGFALYHSAESANTLAIDFREKAPRAATHDMFLDGDGRVDTERSRFSHLSAGVPGSAAGLCRIHARFGSLPLATVMAPAIRLAGDGFPVSRDLGYSLAQARERLARSPAAQEAFFDGNGEPYGPGMRLTLPELAAVLKAIAKEGPEVFYVGWIADRLVDDMAQHGGLITAADLAGYRAVERDPMRGRYRGYEVLSMPPPSSGGVHLVQMLNVLEGYELSTHGHNSAATLHRLAETMKRAYADRSKHLGDSDFYPVPLAWLVSEDYAANLRAKIDLDRATPSSSLAPGVAPEEGDQTTHISVMDAAGNAFSCTTTVNFSFGNHYLVPGLGFFLNNEMDDFSSKPGVPNAFGLVGGEANAIEPEKRMLSSMSPTIVLKGGRPILALGSPGGSRIINATLQAVLNVVDFEMNLAEAVAAPRIHHQWLPDVLFYEQGISPDTVRLLEERGFATEERSRIGNVNAVLYQDGYYQGAADPRALSGTAQGY